MKGTNRGNSWQIGGKVKSMESPTWSPFSAFHPSFGICLFRFHNYRTVGEAKQVINNYLGFYNQERPDQSLDYRTPAEVYYDSKNYKNRPICKDVESAPWYHLGPEYGGKEGDHINDHHLSLTQKKAAQENNNS